MKIKQLMLFVVPLLALSSCKPSTNVELSLSQNAVLLGKKDETFDLKSIIENIDKMDSKKLSYKASDTSIVEIQDDGILKALNYGTTNVDITYSGVVKSIDVAVYNYYGSYSGSKYVEAMQSNIDIELKVKEDLTFDYYRGEMSITVNGNTMKEDAIEIKDNPSLTYKVEGQIFYFTFPDEYKESGLPSFKMTFTLENNTGRLNGKIPTGGALTEMTIIQGEGLKKSN